MCRQATPDKNMDVAHMAHQISLVFTMIDDLREENQLMIQRVRTMEDHVNWHRRLVPARYD